MNTVLTEIKKWNPRYLRKLQNHTNAIAVNLLDTQTENILRSNSTRQTWVCIGTYFQINNIVTCLTVTIDGVWIGDRIYLGTYRT
jgi:hypothetical protein